MLYPYKAVNYRVSGGFLRCRKGDGRFGVSKWILFCFAMMEEGYEVFLTEAKETFSKYVTVKNGDASFKVRFSNHRPILAREARGDCDFFVGVTNFEVTTYEDALQATKARLGKNAGVPRGGVGQEVGHKDKEEGQSRTA